MRFQVDVPFVGVLSDVAARRRVMISGLRRRFLLQFIFLLYAYICAYQFYSHCAKAEMTVLWSAACVCTYVHVCATSV